MDNHAAPYPMPTPNGDGRDWRQPDIKKVESDEISPREILDFLYGNKWIILLCVLVVSGATAAYTYSRSPEYQAASTILVNTQQQNPQLSDILGVQGSNRNIANEVEILRSRTIAMRVADRLMTYGMVPGSGERMSLLEHDEEVPPPSQLQVVERLRGGYTEIRPVSPEVDIIEVIATSTVPAEAALIADVYAEEFVEYNRSLSRSRMTASREFLADVTDRFQSDLESAEEDLTAFLNQEQVVAPEEEASQLIGQVMQLQQEQYETQSELGMARAEMSTLEAEFEQMVPGLAQKISSGEDVMIDRLIQEISELKLLVEQKYARTPILREDPSSDPELERTLSEIASLEADLRGRADRLVESELSSIAPAASAQGSLSGSRDELNALQRLRGQLMEKQIQMSGLGARLEVIDSQLDVVKAELARIPGKEIVLNRLERSLTTREQLYVTLVEKLQEARIAEQSELGYVDIIDSAVIPTGPVRPRVRLNLMLGLALGLLLGIGLSILRKAMDDKIRKPEDVQRRGHNLLVAIPNMERLIKKEFDGQDVVTMNGRRYSTSLISLLQPMSPITEAYRRLAVNLQFCRPDKRTRSILITSPAIGEGKTSTSLNLAIVMAESGRKTVYVDADLRRAMGHKRMYVGREPGLVEAVFRSPEFDLREFKSEIDNLYFVPAGRLVPNPSEILESMKLAEFVRRLEDEFDMVIIDSPPILPVADGLTLSARTDATLVVCSASVTTWVMLDRAMQELQMARASVLGVVLNRFDPASAYGRYSDRYGYSYDYQYADEENDVSSRAVRT